MKKNRNLLCGAMMAVCLLTGAGTVSAQRAYIDERVAEAYNYRDDIAPEVVERAKSWKRPGVLHGNWIENRDGKSIRLDGSEIFPDVDYLRVREYYPGTYEVSQQRDDQVVCGMMRDNGEQVIPIKYHSMYVDVNNGMIECRELSTTADGKVYNHCTDVYKLNGELIASVKYQNPNKNLCSVSVEYKKEHNLIRVHYPLGKSAASMTGYVYYYPDGQVAFGPYETKGYLGAKYGSPGVLYDGKKEFLIPDYAPEAHPRLENDRVTSAELIANDFKRNAWIRKASECFDRGEWENTLNYLSFYDQFDSNYFLGSCPEVFTYAIMWLRSHHALGHNSEIYNTVTADKMSNYGLLYHTKKKYLYTWSQRIDASEETKQAWQVCQDIFNEAASVVLAEQREARRQMNAELWAAALSSLSGTVHQILGPSSSAKTAGGGAVKSTPQTAARNSGSSSGRSDSDETKAQKAPTRECPDCHGYGKVREKTYSGSITRNEPHQCEICGRKYTGQDKCISHRDCNRCHGLGKI